jgi:hypothetical protein
MSFNVAFSGTALKFITPFTFQQIIRILFLAQKTAFGAGISFYPGFSHLT